MSVLRVALVLLLWLVAGLPGGLTLCLCWCPAECTPPTSPCCEAEAPECCDSGCSLETDAHPDPLALPTPPTDWDAAPQAALALAPFQPLARESVRARGRTAARPPPFAQRCPELRL